MLKKILSLTMIVLGLASVAQADSPALGKPELLGVVTAKKVKIKLNYDDCIENLKHSSTYDDTDGLIVSCMVRLGDVDNALPYRKSYEYHDKIYANIGQAVFLRVDVSKEFGFHYTLGAFHNITLDDFKKYAKELIDRNSEIEVIYYQY